MRVKKISMLMVPVLVLLCASLAVAGNVFDYTYDDDGNKEGNRGQIFILDF